MVINPICSVYGIFTYIYPTTGPNVGKYTIDGASGNINMVDFFPDVLQWDEGGRHPATSLWKNRDAVGETRNWNHHFAQQIRFPCWVFSVLFLSGFSYRWRLRLYKLAMMMATVFSGSDKLLRAPAGLEEKSQCPSNSLSGWMDPAHKHFVWGGILVWWSWSLYQFGTTLFSLVVKEEIPRVTIEIEGAPGIPSDWVKCFWKSFAQFSIGNAHQHCFCYLVRPFCFGFEQPPNGGGWFFRPCCFTVVSDFPWLSPNCPSACNAHGQSVRRPFWMVGLKCCRFRMFHHHGNGAMIPTNCSDGELRSRFQMLNRTLVLACFCSMVFPTFLNDGWSWINYNDLTRQRHWNVTECSFL